MHIRDPPVIGTGISSDKQPVSPSGSLAACSMFSVCLSVRLPFSVFTLYRAVGHLSFDLLLSFIVQVSQDKTSQSRSDMTESVRSQNMVLLCNLKRLSSKIEMYLK